LETFVFCSPVKNLRIKTHKTIILPVFSYKCESEWLNIEVYKSIMLPVVLYGCETWFLMLREEHRLMVLENWVLRRICGCKREEMTGGCIMRSFISCTLQLLLG
jgi:hypothetical protein